MPFLAASSWQTTSTSPAWRRKRFATTPPPSKAFGRIGDGGLRDTPSVVAALPFGGAQAPPHSGDFRSSRVEKSSGSHVSLLRKSSVRGSVSAVETVIQTSLSHHEVGRFAVSPDTDDERARKPPSPRCKAAVRR